VVDANTKCEQEKGCLIFATVLKVQRGEPESRWKLSRRQKRSGTYLLVALLVGAFAYTRYTAGDVQTAAFIGVIAIVIALLGLSD
jgi:hypothetical protein